MENKYTPGPWEKDYESKDGIYIRPKGTGFQIALVEARSYRMGKYGSSVEADANLIASAPDLLEACQKAKEALEYHGNDRTLALALHTTALEMLQDAISKVEGKDVS
jgi:hypothetical protein